jgi:hypothetical protein
MGISNCKMENRFIQRTPIIILKPALVREHGYLYIDAVEGSPQMRTWRCAVTDCPNTIVDEV